MAEFKNNGELEAWLEEQPHEVGVVIAARVALRVLPLLVYEFSNGELEPDIVASEIVLPVFRAMTVPWSAAKYGDHGAVMATAASAGRAAVHRAAAARSTAISASATAAAHRAAAASATVVNAAMATAAALAVSTARATAARPADAYAEIKADAKRLEGGITPEKIAGEPLWGNETPDWFHENWEQLKLNLIGLDPDWQRWTYWYEARRDGRLTYRASPKENEQIEIARALIANEIWEKGSGGGVRRDRTAGRCDFGGGGARQIRAGWRKTR